MIKERRIKVPLHFKERLLKDREWDYLIEGESYDYEAFDKLKAVN